MGEEKHCKPLLPPKAFGALTKKAGTRTHWQNVALNLVSVVCLLLIRLIAQYSIHFYNNSSVCLLYVRLLLNVRIQQV